MCCALLAVMANAYRRQVKKERKIEEAAAELVAKQCDEANKRIRDFQAPFACIKASDFVELGRFVQYEKLRRRNLLTYARGRTRHLHWLRPQEPPRRGRRRGTVRARRLACSIMFVVCKWIV